MGVTRIWGTRRRRFTGCAALVVAVCAILAPNQAQAITLPPLFSESVAFKNLNDPTTVRFASDGRVFVAEKSGLIKVFDSLSDPTWSVFADLRTNVYNFWDRGLLGMVLDPNFPIRPYVYVLYAHDAPIGGTAPYWGSPGVNSDPCPTPPGPTSDGCLASGRLSRLTAAGNLMAGPEEVLIEDWCQQYPGHSLDDLAFGADGALYVSAGDSAGFTFTDWGQGGTPETRCADPPMEGGALRAQDPRTPGDPAGHDGSILRVDPATGAGMPGNPFAASSDPNARRIVGYGLRNPFRIAVRPRTNEVWIGDVGWGEYEEVNRISNPKDGVARNFGWPCYEGYFRQPGYDSANLPICENLYAAGASAHNGAFYAYKHSAKVVSNESCPAGTSSISGLDFYDGGPFPNSYDGALFFADYARDCIWAMRAGSNGLPNQGSIQTFGAAASNPVALEVGPGGDLFYVDFNGGAIRRIRYFSGNRPPDAVARANPDLGPAPLNVQFDATASTDPDGNPLSFAWDLDEDGAFDDSTSATPAKTYAQAGQYEARVRVTDLFGAADTDEVTVTVGNSPPEATISAPPPTLLWGVGEPIAFAGAASDAEQGSLPSSAFSWQLQIEHCPGGCHAHDVQDFAGVSTGSFTAPDHEYPSSLILTLTVTDSGGLSDTEQVRIHPETVALTLASAPAGLQLVLNGNQAAAPFTRQLIRGSENSVSAPSPQSLGPDVWLFSAWSDGSEQTHQLVADATRTVTSTFVRSTATVTKSGSLLTYQARPGTGNTVTLSRDPGTQVYSFLEGGITAGSGCTQVTSGRVDCAAVPETAQVTMNMGDGNDAATAGAGGHASLNMNGGDGNDELNSGNRADTLNGGNGNDVLAGGEGNDTLLGAANDDQMLGGAGADTFDGGAGVDRGLYTDHGAGVTVDVEPTTAVSDDDGNSTDGAAQSRDDVKPGVEWVTGTALADVINATASQVAFTLLGLAGDDVLTDSPFNDTLDGGPGADRINCLNGGTDSNAADPADTVTGLC